MNLFIRSIPSEYVLLLPTFSLIAVGYLVETHYVGRISVFSNAIALGTYFYNYENLPFLLSAYINILTVAGLIAVFSYASKKSLPDDFYRLSKIFSSIISGIIILSYAIQ